MSSCVENKADPNCEACHGTGCSCVKKDGSCPGQCCVCVKQEEPKSDLGNYLNMIDSLADHDQKEKEERIAAWSKIPPAKEVEYTRDDHVHKIGFWRITAGLLRIEANVKGAYDPAQATGITGKEVAAMSEAMQAPYIDDVGIWDKHYE